MRSIAELAGKKLRRPLPKKINHNWPLPETLMGIEVEVEAYSGVVMPDNLSMWSTKSDGSLQNGKEYVLASPMAGESLRTAINELMDGSNFVRSLTGSTHIHMDMLEESDSTEVLRVLVMMIYVLEPMLYAAGDKGREWCGFANKLMTGPDELLSFVMDDAISAGDFRQTYGRNSSSFGRYYGMNLAALIDYGSLEFRYFPTATKEEELISWVELVQTFKKAARDVGTLSNLDNIIENEQSFQEFLTTYFGKWSHLFAAIGSHSLLRNDYRKAHITSKLRTPTVSKTVFRPKKIFVDDKFKKLLKYMPDLVATTYQIYKVAATGSAAIPSAASGKVLVYQGRIYFTPADTSPLISSYAPTTWNDVRYVDSFTLAQDPELADTLWGILAEGDVEISPQYIAAINDMPRSFTANTSTAELAEQVVRHTNPYDTLLDVTDDDDDDDYESEMEDE